MKVLRSVVCLVVVAATLAVSGGNRLSFRVRYSRRRNGSDPICGAGPGPASTLIGMAKEDDVVPSDRSEYHGKLIYALILL